MICAPLVRWAAGAQHSSSGRRHVRARGGSRLNGRPLKSVNDQQVMCAPCEHSRLPGLKLWPNAPARLRVAAARLHSGFTRAQRPAPRRRNAEAGCAIELTSRPSRPFVPLHLSVCPIARRGRPLRRCNCCARSSKTMPAQIGMINSNGPKKGRPTRGRWASINSSAPLFELLVFICRQTPGQTLRSARPEG